MDATLAALAALLAAATALVTLSSILTKLCALAAALCASCLQNLKPDKKTYHTDIPILNIKSKYMYSIFITRCITPETHITD